MNPTTRYSCPLNCGWHHDEPSALPDLTGLAGNNIDELVHAASERKARRIELTIRAHCATHEWREWMPALASAQRQGGELRASLEDLFTRWFLNAHAGLDFREAMMGIAADLRSILDNPTRTTPDNPPTSSSAVDNPGQPPGCTQAEGFCDEHGYHRHPPLEGGSQHVYLSTGCLHGEHGYCQSNTGAAGTKVPAQCKFCAAPCRCECHVAP